MHDIDRPLPQRQLDRLPMPFLRPAPLILCELCGKRGGGEQLTSRFGARTGNDQGAVALGNQRTVERRKYLFRPSRQYRDLQAQKHRRH